MSRLPAALAAVTLLAACTSGGPAGEAASERATASVAVASPSSAPGVTEEPTPFLLDHGIDVGLVELTTPVTGGGPRPVLSWEPVDGAAVYAVVVHDVDGAPYWGWELEDTSVRLGLEERPDSAPGPRVAEGMTWSVVAYDADWLPLAASERRPIAP